MQRDILFICSFGTIGAGLAAATVLATGVTPRREESDPVTRATRVPPLNPYFTGSFPVAHFEMPGHVNRRRPADSETRRAFSLEV
ncbi:MAG: hypothetical protein L0Z50_05750 [Verrucomicrobiales bacterium]|nr:hypothetical protein [Verrucomicrobiales bacterium]